MPVEGHIPTRTLQEGQRLFEDKATHAPKEAVLDLGCCWRAEEYCTFFLNFFVGGGGQVG